MEKLTFKQQKIGAKLIREFSPYADLEELKWYRDTTNRDVKIIQGGGWKFQSWDELPKTLKNEDKLYIPRGTWHRVLRGDQPLIIEITEL